MDKPALFSLPGAGDRLTYLYLEKCRVSRDDNAITATDENGVIHIPAASVSTLLFGPGTVVTHRAMELIGEAGVCAVWVSEHGIRCIASGRSLSRSAGMLLRQARLVTNVRAHAEVVRKMYLIRFPGEDVSDLTIQQLRGREGSRIRSLYRSLAKQWRVDWNGRKYDPHHFDQGTPVNQALSVGNSCLYGVATAVITSLGCSPALGFVHVGHELSFSYDIADLYKAETTIPIAFEMAAKSTERDFSGAVRRRIRDEMVRRHILERMVRDIGDLLREASDEQDEQDEQDARQLDALYLWDNRKGHLPSGHQYAEDEETGEKP